MTGVGGVRGERREGVGASLGRRKEVVVDRGKRERGKRVTRTGSSEFSRVDRGLRGRSVGCLCNFFERSKRLIVD